MASMANLAENSQQPRLSAYIPKPVKEFLKQVLAIPDHSLKLSKIDFYINFVENEIKNLDAHKAELPLCINLLQEGVETLKKERMRCVEMEARAKWTSDAENLWMSPIRYEETVDDDGHNTDLSLGSGSNRQGGAVQRPFGGVVIPVEAVEESGMERHQEGPPLKKQRRCWSPELHRKFVEALESLGGHTNATPKQIRAEMKVEGLTNDEVKSHLQKYRLHIKNKAETSGQMWLS